MPRMGKRSTVFCAAACVAAAAFGSAGTAAAVGTGSGGSLPVARPAKVYPAPAKVAEPQLRCGNLQTMQARVRCRLQLSPAELEQEYAAQYLPEECRAIETPSRQASCVAKYRAFQPCWDEPVGDGRVACAQRVLGLDRSVDELVRQCRGSRSCQLAVQEKVYDLIKFRFYELEERVEELLEAGAVEVGQAATAISAIEEQKAAFNAAADNRERQQIVYAVRKIWQELAAAAKR